MAKVPMCLRCEKRPAFTKRGFTSAWCVECHQQKFGCTHDEKKFAQDKNKLPNKVLYGRQDKYNII